MTAPEAASDYTVAIVPPMWRGIAVAGGAQFYSLASGLLLLLLTARWLGPDGRGAYATVTAWAALYSSILQLSLGQVVVHRASHLRDRPWLSQTLGSLAFLTAILTAIGWTVAAGTYIFLGASVFGHTQPGLLALGFLLLPFLIWEQFGSALLISIGRLRVYNVAQIAGRTLVMVVAGIAWYLGFGIASLLLGAIAGQMIVALRGTRELLSRATGAVLPDRATIRALFVGGLKLHWNYVGGAILSTGGVLMVNRYVDPGATGQYQLAQAGISILAVLPQAASLVLLERVAALGPDEAWEQQRTVVMHLAILSVLMSVASIVLAPWIVPLALGRKFEATARLFQITALALPGMTLAGVMSSQWVGRGLFVTMSLLTCALAAMSLGLNAVLIPRRGAAGAAWTIVIVYLLAAIAQLALFYYCERRRRHRKTHA